MSNRGLTPKEKFLRQMYKDCLNDPDIRQGTRDRQRIRRILRKIDRRLAKEYITNELQKL